MGNGCNNVGAPTAPRPFTPVEREQFAAMSIVSDQLKSKIIDGMVKGTWPISAVPISRKNGRVLMVQKSVVPGTLRWNPGDGRNGIPFTGETGDLMREDTVRWRWLPKPGTGQWFSQTIDCPEAASGFLHGLAQPFISIGEGFAAFPQNAKAAVRAACDLLRDHPAEVGAATDVATMAAGAPPGSGQQAQAQAQGVCNALFPPATPNAPPPPAHVLPAGSITARDTKTGAYRIAIPIGLGDSSVTHVEIASSVTAPVGAKLTTIPDFDRRVGKSIWTKPSTYVAGGAILLGAGALGYALMRRRHRT